MKDTKLKPSGLIAQIQIMSGLSTTEFLSNFIGYQSSECNSNPQAWTNLKDGDYFTKNLFSVAEQYLCNYDQWMRKIEKKYPLESKEEVLNNLLRIIENNDLYYSPNNPAGKKEVIYKKYNEEYLEKLTDSLRQSLEAPMYITNKDVYNFLWATVYLAVFKRIPDSFLIEDRIYKDTQEYNRKVLLRYGGSSVAAYRSIYTLAKEGNLVAQTELADLYYYGKINKNIKEYRKAFFWYFKAAGDLNNPSGAHYPLACWSLAYILFNYRFRRDLKHRIHIPEIENMSVFERRKKAIQYCLLALQTDSGICVQAYNLLGVIMDVMDSIFRYGDSQEVADAEKILKLIQNNDFICHLLGSKPCTPETFFQIASDSGYVEACNNLGRRELKRVIFEPHNQLEHIEKACKYLEISSLQNSTWASNKLGELYRTGKVSVYLDEFDRTETIYIYSLINSRKALEHYLRAVECFYDRDSAWAAVHLLESFSTEIDPEMKRHCIEIIHVVSEQAVMQYCQSACIAID